MITRALLTRAELLHLQTALQSYKYWQSQYPETIGDSEEDELLVAMQIVEEKI